MKRVATVLALVGLMGLPALADQMGGGLSGHVVDINTGQPVAHMTILYYKAPYLENGENRIIENKTDSKGWFTDITLQPGRYIIMARDGNNILQGCAVDDVQTGEVSRLKIEIGRNMLVCSGPRVHPTVIDPNLTADLYRI
jgi:5-hydroxyisourate hydrolase-like protein (transthyretin family)